MEEDFLKKKEKEEKKKKRGFLLLFGERRKSGKLWLLLLAFLFTLIGLSASTYAWFTSNFTVSVQEINVNVSSGSGIQISTNAVDWKSLITITDITTGYTGATNQLPTSSNQVNPVSTVSTVYPAATTKSAGLKMFRGTITNDVGTGTMYLNTTQETDGNNTNYVAFDLFLKLDFSAAKQVYLTPTTGITGGATNTNIQYAGRMGFVVNGHGASSAEATDLQSLKESADYQVLIYEPNYDVHTSTGLANGRNNYQITDRQLTGNATACPYYGVLSAFSYDPEDLTNHPGIPLNDHNAARFAAVTPNIKTTLANDQRTAFLTLQPGVTKIRVYMWVEGQDIDCENYASGGEIKFNLGFTVDENNGSGNGS